MLSKSDILILEAVKAKGVPSPYPWRLCATASFFAPIAYIVSTSLISVLPLSVIIRTIYPLFCASFPAEKYKLRDTYLKSLIELKLSNITEEGIQYAINVEAKDHAPKTVRNISGALSAVLKAYRPEFVYTVKLPQKEKPEIYIPTSEEIKKLLEHFKDTEMEIPIMLAAFLGLRQSEIVGLKWKNVSEDCKTIKIDSAIVSGEDNKLFEKAPKSTAGNRNLSVPKELADKLKKSERHTEYVTQLNATAIYKRFSKALKTLGIKHFRFHDLRHYNASVMLSLNIPNKYAQARMGHATDNMLKNVYQHLMSEKEKEVNENVNKYFDDLFK